MDLWAGTKGCDLVTDGRALARCALDVGLLPFHNLLSGGRMGKYKFDVLDRMKGVLSLQSAHHLDFFHQLMPSYELSTVDTGQRRTDMGYYPCV